MIDAAARSAIFELIAVPLAFTRVRTRVRVARRTLREPVGAHGVSLLRCLAHSVLSAGVGVVGWFLALLSVLVLVRGLAYPMLVGDGYRNAWGGPTPAGAWAVHAVLGLLLAPSFLAVVAVLGRLQVRLIHTVLGGHRSWWPIPLAVVFTAAGTLFCIAWSHQI
ncbi:hypothetical protein [Nocardia caishijiensis]|uniref:Yip1 domain-containing protein n=1 Tax=Nocardia caishijiensis TaxID=184756 RepID=A0ABQ6YMN1_9NOCA|nr:hypothetical protein [Nocardia caishijiensis]KAF0846966.1 hypothetical protein FNL39_104388 [Nocardia caishijiensis]